MLTSESHNQGIVDSHVMNIINCKGGCACAVPCTPPAVYGPVVCGVWLLDMTLCILPCM